VQTFVSQADGAGNPYGSSGWAWQGLYALVPFSLLLVVAIALFIEPAIALLGPSAEMQAGAVSYVLARVSGEVALTVVRVLTAFFRGFGDTHTPLYITLGANAVNAVLDYGLIFGNLGLPEWGVAGAGVATAVANWLAAAALFSMYRRRSVTERFDTRPRAPDRVAMLRFLRTGAPIGGQWFMGMTSFAVFTTLVSHMGDKSMAASHAFLMLLSISFMQAVGISTAATTLVGRYIGSRDLDAAARSLRSALALGVCLASVVAVLFVSFPEPLLRIFSREPDVLALGLPLVLMGALFQLFDAIAIITEGALRGAGDTRWPFVIELALGWGFFLPLAWTLAFWLEGGLMGAWLGSLIHIIVVAVVLGLRYRSGAWKRITI